MKFEQKTITTIIADEGKLLKRKRDGWIAGERVTLGYNYYESGIGLSEPVLETPADYEEIDKPEDYETVPVIDHITRLKNATRMIDYMKNSIQDLEVSAYDALEIMDWYPELTTSLYGTQIKTGDRYRYDEKLWEAIKDFTFQIGWEPGINTASMWVGIDKNHAGTFEDPIPYFPPMEIFLDKFYIQGDIIYRCTRNSEVALTHDLSALVGHYVEIALYPGTGEEHQGTLEDPIPFSQPMEIFEGKYYIQNDVIYKCIRDSGIPLTYDLSALIGHYVETI